MNILFDLDGTLTDPRVGIVNCIQYALMRLGRDPAGYTNLERFIGPPLLASFVEILGNESEAEQALKYYRERFGEHGLYENKMYEDIENSLDRLSMEGHRLFIATTKPRIYAVRIVQHFKMGRYFSGVYGSELDGRLTDKADLIAVMVEKERLNAGSSVMVGDRSHDVAGATVNKFRSVGVLWGYGSEQELMEAGASVICDSPSNLVSCITELM